MLRIMVEPRTSFKPNPGKPKLKLPAGACDTHFHIFGPTQRFPFAPERSYTPTCDAPKETLFKLHAHLGIERGVVVQSAAHAFDTKAAADLMSARPASYRGIALVPIGISMKELERLDAQGFVGARFHYTAHLGAGAPIEEVLALGKQLADLGWHLQIHLDAARIEELGPALKRSPVPVVIDHMGRIDASLGIDQKPFQDLLQLMKQEKFLVKVSCPERASRQAAPWEDAIPFARKLVAEFGDRALWGTDWPHPNLEDVPDDGLLVDLIAEIAPTEPQRRALLVDNPKRFYRFR
jgi:2-pyrone-4,6-dicarboxylate lactonase